MASRKKSPRLKTRTSKPAPLKTTPQKKAQEKKTPAAAPAAEAAGFPIVGIGASAGGLEAVSELLRNLPAKARLAFVLVHHLNPDQPSALAEILSRATRMKVVEAGNGMKVECDHVYVIPPNKTLGISRGILRLSPRGLSAEPHMPVNYFFRALAEDQGGCAVGVVLSGTGDDGTQGLEAIKAADGITFAQTVKSAKHTSMPASASAAADFILSPAGIAAELVRIGKHPCVTHGHAAGAVRAAVDKDGFREICTLLRTLTGIEFSHYKPNTLHRRISRRMVLQKVEDMQRYVALLRRTPGELDALVQDLLISVTGFFRDPKTFDFLKKKIFPRILRHKNGDDEAIRVWVPGCSTGEEVYSLAIILIEFCEANQRRCRIQIFGTDVNETILARARNGMFRESIKGEITPERLRRFFTSADGGYRINKSIRDLCIFARQNLVTDAPFSRMDLISCRNVLIYFGPAMQKRVLPVFHYALNPRGFLLLGTAESVGGFTDLFELVDAGHCIYMRRATTSHAIAGMPPFVVRGAGKAGQEPPPPRSDDAALTAVRQRADAIVLGEFSPGGVVVNSRLDILQFRGRTGMFLEHAPGAANLNLLQMAREGLALELRPLIAKAAKSKRSVIRSGVQVRNNGNTIWLDVRVIPFQTAPSDEQFFLVVFHEKTAPSAPATVEGKAARPSALQQEVEQTRTELAAARQSLHMLMEDHDAATEELRAANEEALSSNEELQSTNEELETAKEELQSTNEELTTLNEELQNRNKELQEIGDDLLNLFNSVDFSIVMLGRDLRIRRFTPKAQVVLNLIPADVGRPLTDLKFSLDVPDLQASIVRVLDSLTVEEREIQDRGGRWFQLRIRPYRTADNRIDGAVVTLTDINHLKLSLLAAERAQRFADAIVATAREPVLVLDGKLRVKMGNRKFHETFGLKPAETHGRFIYDLGDGQWDIPELRKLLEKILPTKSVVEDYEFTAKFAHVGVKKMLLNAARLATPKADEDWILIAMENQDGSKT